MSFLRKSFKRASLHRRVPDQHVIIVEKDGLIERLAGPGEVRINHLQESYGDLVKIGPQSPVEIRLEEVRSAEGDLFKVQSRITYGFDPRYCNFRILPHLVRRAPQIQASILQTFAGQNIRDVVGEFSSATLRLGSTPREVEFKVKRRLRQQVLFAGIVLYKIVVTQIAPPPTLETAFRAAREKMVTLNTESYQRQILAKVAASEEITLAKAVAYATQLKGEANTREREIIYRLLAELGLDLTEQITNTEALGKLAENVASLNVLSPFGMPLNTAVMATLFGQPAVVNGNGHHNGKKF